MSSFKNNEQNDLFIIYLPFANMPWSCYKDYPCESADRNLRHYNTTFVQLGFPKVEPKKVRAYPPIIP